MKHLLRTFLNDLGGNPNKRNGLNETVLHTACQLNQTKSFSAQERRAACVQLLLYWKGISLNNGEQERVDIAAQDRVSTFTRSVSNNYFDIKSEKNTIFNWNSNQIFDCRAKNLNRSRKLCSWVRIFYTLKYRVSTLYHLNKILLRMYF